MPNIANEEPPTSVGRSTPIGCNFLDRGCNFLDTPAIHGLARLGVRREPPPRQRSARGSRATALVEWRHGNKIEKSHDSGKRAGALLLHSRCSHDAFFGHEVGPKKIARQKSLKERL